MKSEMILITKKEPPEMNTKELILELFKASPNTIYKNQEHISKAIFERFSITRKQAAVSKALKKIGNKIISYRGDDYYIVKLEDGYVLYKKGDIMDEATQNFADKNVFENYVVYVITKNVVAYTIRERYHEYVKNYMVKIFDEDSFFDIISHGKKLYFLLNTKDHLYDQIFKFPQRVKEIQQINQERHLHQQK